MSTKLQMSMLAVDGKMPFGNNENVVMRSAATQVTELVMSGAGHWFMEEAPDVIVRPCKSFWTDAER